MSNALAIASVTAVLKDLLDNALIDSAASGSVGDRIKVTASTPDRIATGETESAQLNLFLYNITPNLGWRNVGLPSRNDRGERLTNPPLGLDLHYLLTAYEKDDLEAEVLLGYAMQVLHETPILTRRAIRQALGSGSVVDGDILPPALRALNASDLADQVELIKITPQALSTEEMSKLWTAFQSKFRPSVAYHVSVVLIESRGEIRPTLPVRERNIYVEPFRQPFIEQVISQAGAYAPIDAESTIRILGRQLRGENVQVKINGAVLNASSANDTEIEVALNSLPAGSLRSGVQGSISSRWASRRRCTRAQASNRTSRHSCCARSYLRRRFSIREKSGSDLIL